MSWDVGNGYRAYVFEESTRRCAIDRKGRGRKEVIFTSASSDVIFLASVGITVGPSSFSLNHVWGTLASFVKIIIKIRQADIADI